VTDTQTLDSGLVSTEVVGSQGVGLLRVGELRLLFKSLPHLFVVARLHDANQSFVTIVVLQLISQLLLLLWRKILVRLNLRGLIAYIRLGPVGYDNDALAIPLAFRNGFSNVLLIRRKYLGGTIALLESVNYQALVQGVAQSEVEGHVLVEVWLRSLHRLVSGRSEGGEAELFLAPGRLATLAKAMP